MRFAIACNTLLALFFLACPTVWAQLDNTTAKNLGLESAWKSQVQLPRAGTGVVSSHLWAEAQNPRQFAVVELENQTIRVSAEALDKDGKPIGIELAKTQAQKEAAKVLGRSDGFQVVEVSIPRVKLVVITNDGLVQALDAETGRVLWTQACGLSGAPAFPGAVSPMGVSLIHGDELYLLDWDTGKALMTQKLRFSTSNAIAVCNDIAFVSDFSGRVQAYGLGARSQLPWSYVMQGRAVGPTANMANQAFCAIATDAGFVYVYAGGETPSVYIRYETSSPLTGSLAAGNNAFYAGTAEGLVSKITLDDRLGNIKWELRLNTTVTAPPLVTGKYVYVASEAGELVAIEDDTGMAEWVAMSVGVRQPLARAGGMLYCLSLTGELVAIDADTGQSRGRTRPLALSRPITNQLSDRLYLISKYGQVQCLRPVGATLPTIIAPIAAPVGEDSTSVGNESALGVPREQPTGDSTFNFGAGATPGAGVNPFGTPTETGSEPAGNPFGGGGGAGNPFGGDSGAGNPFGGGGDTNPFGGSDPQGGSGDTNPFGGSGN